MRVELNKTGYFTHPDCWKHEMGEGHPECPERLSAIEARLQHSALSGLLDRREAHPPVSDIELAHGRMYVASIRGLTDVLRERSMPVGPHTQVDPIRLSMSTPGMRRCAPRAQPWQRWMR